MPFLFHPFHPFLCLLALLDDGCQFDLAFFDRLLELVTCKDQGGALTADVDGVALASVRLHIDPEPKDRLKHLQYVRPCGQLLVSCSVDPTQSTIE